jgi:type II secretory pathway pseudopilin PulG
LWFLLAAIAIPNFLRARLSVNESVAGTTIKTISGAIDTYAKANNGQYPSSESALKLTQPYNNQTINGYIYSLSLSSDSYELIAKPAECGATGVKVFKAKSGAAISTENCK